MECEARRPKPVFSDGLTMTAMHARQFEWLIEVSKERETQFVGEKPERVAMYWARQKGISAKAIAKVLGTSSRAVSDALYTLRRRLEANPVLQLALTPP
jgi:DNA-binding NarL/FixJ family response regulator